jgi:hypothetical protein
MASEIFQAIGAGKAAIDGLKLLAQYADDVKDVTKRGEFMRIIGELSLELAETQVRLSGHIRENDELKEQVLNLQKEVEALKNPDATLAIKDGLYYTSEGDGPFCTCCYDSDRKTIRLADMPAVMDMLGKYECPKCKSRYAGGKGKSRHGGAKS